MIHDTIVAGDGFSTYATMLAGEDPYISCKPCDCTTQICIARTRINRVLNIGNC